MHSVIDRLADEQTYCTDDSMTPVAVYYRLKTVTQAPLNLLLHDHLSPSSSVSYILSSFSSSYT